jgi:hypothetical protein
MIILCLGQRLHFYPALHPDSGVMVNLLLLILIIITKSCVLYLLTNILSSLLFLVHQHEFEEYLDNDITPKYQGPWNRIESELSTTFGTMSIGG